MKIEVCVPVYRKVALMLMTTWAICGMASVNAWTEAPTTSSASTTSGTCYKYSNELGRYIRLVRCRDGRCVLYIFQCHITTAAMTTEPEESCYSNIFRRHRCPDGRCVRQSYQCDVAETTAAVTTEESCYSNIFRRHRCPDGRCVRQSYQCDVTETTAAMTTEESCYSNIFRRHRCPDGRCVRQSYQCDESITTAYPWRSTTEDCLDNAYETYKCPDGSCVEYWYQCGGYSTIPYSRGSTACWENTYMTYTCADGTCVENSNECGGTYINRLYIAGPTTFMAILVIAAILTWRCRVRRITAGLETSSRCAAIVGCGRSVPYAPLQNIEVLTVTTVTPPQNQPQIIGQQGTASPVSNVPPPPNTTVMATQAAPLL